MTNTLGRHVRDIESFEGPTYFATGLSDEALGSLRGLRVGLVGSAPSLIETARELLRVAHSVTIFDPAIPWVLPAEAKLLPGFLQIPAAKRHLRNEVDDLWLRDRMTPKGAAVRSDVVFTSGFHSLFTRDGCDLVTWPIAGADASGVRTADGLVHLQDALVMEQISEERLFAQAAH